MQRESSGALAATFVVVDGPDSAFPGERINSGPIWPYWSLLQNTSKYTQYIEQLQNMQSTK